MFNKDFYPTPSDVIDVMLQGIVVEGKRFLEPSAGKGDIVDRLQMMGAEDVCIYEKDESLSIIASTKGRFLGDDFLKAQAEEISHVNYIVMNPPFSCADSHILHAWDIAPEGCQIIALCNSNTLENDYSEKRKRLLRQIEENGDGSIDLGACFDTAERTTGVNVSMVRLFKPVTSADFDFEGFCMDAEPEIHSENGIMQFNEVQAIVNTYVSSVKCFDDFNVIARRMNAMTKLVDFGSGFSFNVSYQKQVSSKEDFAKEMQKHCWRKVFAKMNLNKFVTSGVMKDINKFVETQQKYPFTVRNVYKMFEVIIGTRQQTLEKALVEAVDNFTRHTHENRYNVEGWKTNAGHMLNKKFIMTWMVEVSYGGKISARYNGHTGNVEDLLKILCNLTASDYSQMRGFREVIDDAGDRWGKWIDWDFFEICCYKKGTVHFKFKDLKHWELLNREYARIKGEVLPEKL